MISQSKVLTIPHKVVEKVFSSSQESNPRHKEYKTMTRQRIKFILVALLAIMSFPATAQATKSKKETGATVKVTKLTAKATATSKKLKKCFSHANKIEMPAPPRDPLAHCKGKIQVKVSAKAVASCKKGWIGGSATASVNVKIWVNVRAFSQAIASGRAEATAKTRIRTRVSGKATASVNCVKPLPAGTPVQPPSGGGQSNNASQDATAKNDCTQYVANSPNNGSQCPITIIQIIQQINANCALVQLGDGSVVFIENNSVVNICSTQTTTPPPVTPPSDNPPQISCVIPAHVILGRNVPIYCESQDADNDAMSVNVIATGAGHISGTVPDNRWDGSACPDKVKCTRSTFWGDRIGDVVLTATVTAKGKIAVASGNFPVVPEPPVWGPDSYVVIDSYAHLH